MELRMSAQHVLLLCFSSAALWDGNTGIVILQKYSGDQLRFAWHFASNTSVKFFCRRECKDGDVLLETEQNEAMSGRYSIEYKETPPVGGHVTGFIKRLQTSDSGRYRIGVGRPLVPDMFGDFEIRVNDPRDGNRHQRINIHTGEEGGDLGVICQFYSSSDTKFFCRNDCRNGNVLVITSGDGAQSGRYSLRYKQEPQMEAFVVGVKISQLNLNDSGLYSCGLGSSLSSASFRKFEISVTAAPAPATPAAPAAPTSPVTQSSALHPETYIKFSALPLLGCSLVIVVLSVAVVVALCKLKEKNQNIGSIEFTTYENPREDPTYEGLDSGCKEAEQTYSTLKHT